MRAVAWSMGFWQVRVTRAVLIFLVKFTTSVVPVALDIRPGTCPNPFNLKLFDQVEEGQKPKKGEVIPIAILGTDALDVSDIDITTVRLEGVAPLVKGSKTADLSTAIQLEDCGCMGEGPDGFDDLALKFRAQDIAAAITPVFKTRIGF